MDQAQTRHVLGLDLIRFAAAAMVMAFHYGHDISHIPLSWTGWVGVEVFFVLSGYVIAASAEGSPALAFGTNRIVRIMPAVWLCSTLIVAMCAFGGGAYPDLGMRYLRSVTLWPVGPWVDGVIWTLPVEIAFYVLVFLALVGRVSIGFLLRIIASVSGIYWPLRVSSQFVPEVNILGLVRGLPSDGPAFSILGYGCYFALGSLVREGLKTGWSIEWLAFISLCLLGGLSQISFTASNWATQGELVWLPHAQKLVPACVWLACSALILISVWGNDLAWRYLAPIAPAVRLLGLSTYPLYLLHDAVGNALIAVPLARTPACAALVAIGVSLAFAATLEPLAQTYLRSLLPKSLACLPARRRAVIVDRAMH